MAVKRKNITYVDASKYLAGLDRSISEVSQELEDMTIEAAKLGADRVKYYIATRGTNKIWGNPNSQPFRPSFWFSKKTGRYRDRSTSARFDSGDMFMAVNTKVQAGPRESRAVFGWVNDPENYYQYQETGFFNVKAGKSVEGMFALRDARKDVVSALPKLAKKYAGRISRRLEK
jgi:hypothetical protein